MSAVHMLGNHTAAPKLSLYAGLQKRYRRLSFLSLAVSKPVAACMRPVRLPDFVSAY